MSEENWKGGEPEKFENDVANNPQTEQIFIYYEKKSDSKTKKYQYGFKTYSYHT